MRGFCKCDICGNIYHHSENKNYDGLMVWYCNDDGDTITGKRSYNITGPDGKLLKTFPEMMDVCPNCFELFCNWIRMTRNEVKSSIKDDDFPMNKPE